MANYDGSVRINTQLNTSEFNTGISGMSASLKKLAGAVGAAFSIAALVKFGQECIELSSDLTEVDNVVSKSFGNMRGQMDALANESIRTLGMSRLTAYQTGSTFMSMGKAMMDDQQAAADMAIELTKLTGNMSSFYNQSQDLVSIALKSVYTGETETLKQYGIVMTEVNLKQFALQQGITKSYSAMTQAEKVQLRYNYVMAQTAFIGDDFLDTQDTWANQTRILSEQWKEFMTVLGNGLITVLTPVIHVLNSIVSALITFANTVGAVMSKVFGIKGQQMSVASTTEDTADAYEDAATAAEGYSAATDSASKSAKSAVASFDDVNVLQQNSGSSSSGGSSDSSAVDTTEIEAEESAIDQVSDALARAQQVWAEFTQGLNDGFNFASDFLGLDEQVENIKSNCARIKKALTEIFTDPAVNKSLDNFAYSIGDALGKMAASTLSVGLTIGENITGGLALYLEQNTERIRNFLVDIFDISADTATIMGNFSVAFAEIFSALGDENGQRLTASIIGIFTDAAMGLLEISAKIRRDITEVFFQPIIDNADGIKEVFDGLLDGLATLAEGFKEHIDNMADIFNAFYDEHLKPLFDAIAEGFSVLLGTFIEAWNNNIQPALNELLPLLAKLMTALDPLFSALTTVLGWLVNILKVLWTGICVPFLSYLITILGGALTLAIKGIAITVEGVLVVVKTAVTIVKAVIDTIDKMLDKFADGIKAGFKAVCYFAINVLNGIIGGIQFAINGVITMINVALSALNTLVSGIEGVLEHFGMSTGIPQLRLEKANLTKISYPALAAGGITTGRTLAEIGEAGREAVLPLENNTGWMNDLADMLVNAMGSRGSAEMTIDGQTFGQLIYPYITGETSRIGTNLATN